MNLEVEKVTKNTMNYYYDLEYQKIYKIDEMKQFYIEYIANNEIDFTYCFYDFLKNATGKNGSFEIITLNIEKEYLFIKNNLQLYNIQTLIAMINTSWNCND
jgi:hypothetical protein